MSRTSFAVLAALLASLPLLVLAGDRARAEEPAGAAEPKRVEPGEAVGSLMRALRANKGPVRVQMPVGDADRASAGAAKHIFKRYQPLRGSWLDKEGRLDGIVDWDVDLDEGNTVDCITAILLPGPYDKGAMAKTLVAVGKEIGLEMAPDTADPDTWFDVEAQGVTLWITLGDGIVVLEAEGAE